MCITVFNPNICTPKLLMLNFYHVSSRKGSNMFFNVLRFSRSLGRCLKLRAPLGPDEHKCIEKNHIQSL